MEWGDIAEDQRNEVKKFGEQEGEFLTGEFNELEF